jgi:APA family basic amino acid/polyamine antiporter
MDPGLTAALATGLGLRGRPLFRASRQAVALAGIAIVAAANLGGCCRKGVTAPAVARSPFSALVALGLFSGAGDPSHFAPFFARRPDSPALFLALAGAVVSGFFSFGGWWEASKLAGEVEDAPRNVPRALFLGVLTVALIYVSVSAVFLFLVPLDAVQLAHPAKFMPLFSLGVRGRVLSAIVFLSVLAASSHS